MTREAKVLWAAFAILMAAFIALVLSSCGSSLPPAKRAEVLSCLDLANAALENATTCEEARVALAKAIEKAPACVQLFGAQINLESDAGLMLPCDQL